MIPTSPDQTNSLHNLRLRQLPPLPRPLIRACPCDSGIDQHASGAEDSGAAIAGTPTAYAVAKANAGAAESELTAGKPADLPTPASDGGSARLKIAHL